MTENALESIDRHRRVLLRSAMGIALSSSIALPHTRGAFAADAARPAVAAWGDDATLVSAIGAGTLAVESVAQTSEAYQKGFGYVEHWRGKIPKEMAEFWGVPAMAGRNAAAVGPPGFQRGMIRLVELGNDFRKTSYYDTLGWVALEIHVKKPEDVVTQLKNKGLPFTHTGGPGQANAPDGAPLYRAAQFKGPSDEPLYMTQHLQLDQLTTVGRNNVGPLFIQTLNTYPYEATRDFYLQTLGMKMRLESETRRKVEGGARGARMSAVRMPEFCSIQIDEFGKGTPQRPAAPGCFSAGVNMSTLTTRDIDAVKSALAMANVKYREVASNTCPPFSGARALFLNGIGGERLEIVQPTRT